MLAGLQSAFWDLNAGRELQNVRQGLVRKKRSVFSRKVYRRSLITPCQVQKCCAHMVIMNLMRNIEWRPLRKRPHLQSWKSSVKCDKQGRPTKFWWLFFSVNPDFSQGRARVVRPWILKSTFNIAARLEDNFLLTKSNHRHAAIIMRKHRSGTRLCRWTSNRRGEQKTCHTTIEPQLSDFLIKIFGKRCEWLLNATKCRTFEALFEALFEAFFLLC